MSDKRIDAMLAQRSREMLALLRALAPTNDYSRCATGISCIARQVEALLEDLKEVEA